MEGGRRKSTERQRMRGSDRPTDGESDSLGSRNDKLPPEKERKAVCEWTGTERKGQVFFPAGSSLQDPQGCLSFLRVTLRLCVPSTGSPRRVGTPLPFSHFHPVAHCTPALEGVQEVCAGSGWLRGGHDEERRLTWV